MRWVSCDANVTSPFSSSGFASTVMDMSTMSAFTKPSDVPKWAGNYSLELCGCYYEGFIVDDNDFVSSQHCMESMTM